MYVILTHFNLLFAYHRLRSSSWLKPALRVGLIALVLCLASVLAQLAYPANRALPFARVQGQRVALQSTAQLHNRFESLNSREITIKTEKKAYQTSFAAIGVTVNSQTMTSKVMDYPTKLRLVPFSLLFHKPQVYKLDLNQNDEQLNIFANTLMQENDAVPVNAVVSIENAEVKVTPGVAGRVYDRKGLLRQISELYMQPGATLNLVPTQTPPAITTEQATVAADQAKQRLTTPLTLRSAGAKTTLDKTELAGAIRFTTNENTLQVDYDRTAVAAAIQRLANSMYIAPKPEVIALYDGVETSHQPGAVGRTVAVDANIDSVINSLRQGSTDLELPPAAVGFTKQIYRDYSRSNNGLQLLVNDWIAANGGNYSVVLRSVDGSIAANYNADRQFVSASLYKLFVAYAVGLRLESGSLQPSDPTSTGQSVTDCLEVMIVVSSNACGHALGEIVGWGGVDGQLQAKGFNGTSLGSLVTRSSDVALFLQQLYAHNLVSSGFDDTLLDKLGRQIYRSGIPKGVPGVTVKNKVGYVDGYVHDGAIVYNPRGHYVLVVMSTYGNYSRIADLAGKINTIMNK